VLAEGGEPHVGGVVLIEVSCPIKWGRGFG